MKNKIITCVWGKDVRSEDFAQQAIFVTLIFMLFEEFAEGKFFGFGFGHSLGPLLLRR
jgi:hypothetical protein